MRTLLFIILFTPWVMTNAQTKKFSVGLEYSPNMTNLINGSFLPDGPVSLGHNLFIKGGIHLNQRLSLTTGVGFMTTKNYEQTPLGVNNNIFFVETQRKHEYLVVPVGFRYQFGQFYIQPEIGLAWNLANYVDQTLYQADGNTVSIIRQTFNENFISPSPYKKITVPVFLTLGSEFDLGSISLLFGIKGYYSFSDISNRTPWPEKYFGVGLMTGMRF